MNALIKWFKGHGVMYYQCWEGEDIGFRYPRFRVRPMFAWYDLWIGVFVDRKARQIYVFPLPCLGFQIGYQPGRFHRAS